MKTPEAYALITSAKIEAPFVEALIESVAAQTQRPLCWVIVDDGSEDGTAEIIESAVKRYLFIDILRRRTSQQRNFASKARALTLAYDRLQQFEFGFIGNLDADVTLPPDYYERLLHRMRHNPRLGIAGGVIWDKRGYKFQRTISNPIHPPGAIMLFRLSCFQEVGGYRPVSSAGEDSIAVLSARMKGWETRAFDDLPVYHHKPVGSSTTNVLRRCFGDGMTDYHIATHPLFAVLKAIRRLRDRPYLLSSIIRLCGYFYLWIRRVTKDASPELDAYVSGEQLSRMKSMLVGKTWSNK